MINVLISLHKGYGLGDAVQMSAVLRHVVAARPNWKIDYQAEEGKHQVGRGIVSATFAYGDPHPSPHYDAEVQICLYDTWANWGDRPNTRVSSCLRERFGLEWKAEYGRYQCNYSRDVGYAAQIEMMKITAIRPKLHPIPGVVAVHYQGDSSKANKDLTQTQADEVCNHIRALGRIPFVMGRHNTWGGSAEMNCAVISQCEAFVGIDSGPGKCASATDTPSLITWTGHHPAPFHDPAPNTTHLVPKGYHGLQPVCSDRGVIKWFEDNYKTWQYWSDPVGEIKVWLKEVLK